MHAAKSCTKKLLLLHLWAVWRIKDVIKRNYLGLFKCIKKKKIKKKINYFKRLQTQFIPLLRACTEPRARSSKLAVR